MSTKISGKKIALIVLIGTIGIILLADEYPALRFRGDGRFSGGPVFGYWIRFRRVPFYVPGEYIFHFRGMPKEEMSLQLYAEGKSLDNEAELTHLGTTIEARLIDQNGHMVCEAVGSPLVGRGKIDDDNPKGWVTMLSFDEAAYWNGHCLRLPLKPSDSYTLTIRIGDIDSNTPKVNLIPTLEGGQLDLP
jgi:hypothetical protein